MRRIIRLGLTALAFVLISAHISIAAEKILTVAPVSGAPGEEVAVNVIVNDATQLAGASFTVNFDDTKLDFSRAESTFFPTFEDQNIDPPSVSFDNSTYTSALVYNLFDSNSVMIAAARTDNGTGTNVTLFTLYFNIKADAAAGTYPINITPSILYNTDAGYSAEGTPIPMLIGMDGANFVTHTQTVTDGSITIAVANIDTDKDGISDTWEMTNFGNLVTANASTDTDGDGYSDLDEFNNSTDPMVRTAPGSPGYNIYTDKQARNTGDFDGNGTLDLLLRDQISGRASILFADKGITPVFSFTEPNLAWVIKGTGDYNGDGKSDILFHNSSTGAVYIYLMDGATKLPGNGSPGTVSDLNFVIQTTGDFDGDGKSDILWRNKVTGQIYMWFMNGSVATSKLYALTESSMAWVIKDTGDFNGDGKADILFHNSTTGAVYIYLMDGATKLPGNGSPGTVSDLNYVIQTTGDFNGDGNSDILWRNKISGQIYMWFMNGSVATSKPYVATQIDQSHLILGCKDKEADADSDIFWMDLGKDQMYFWEINSTSIIRITYLPEYSIKNDFNGDFKSDILWRNMVSGQIFMWFMNGLVPTSIPYAFTEANMAWVIKDSADFNGDGKADILFHNSSTGAVYIYLMEGATRIAGSGSPGTVSDLNFVIQSTGDFNGDGKSDILWRNKVSGQIFMWFMNGSVATSKPFAFTESNLAWVIKDSADFNGDGKTDILFHNSATGQVYIYLMDGITRITGHGSPGTLSDLNNVIQSTGDFNGDGKSDILWRNTVTGEIHMWFMDGSVATSKPFAFTESNLAWVIKDSYDFNGDGRADILFHNSSSGQVFIYLMNGITRASGGSPGTVRDLNFVIQ